MVKYTVLAENKRSWAENIRLSAENIRSSAENIRSRAENIKTLKIYGLYGLKYTVLE